MIVWSEVDTPTCTLFTGHIGCGKSTELLKLRQELEAEGFHVIYFKSSDDLEMADVDIGDVLLAIAQAQVFDPGELSHGCIQHQGQAWFILCAPHVANAKLLQPSPLLGLVHY